MCNSSAAPPQHNVNERVREGESGRESGDAVRNGDKLHEITNYALSNCMPYK